MALSGSTVFEVRTAGADTNGGGFVTGASGSDYSQQDAKNTVGSDISTTDAVANGTTTLTSATANFGTTIVGNIIYLQGGTGSLAAGWYQVTARASTTSITLDRTVAAGTGITMNIGGALASMGRAATLAIVSGMYVYLKSGTYAITSTTQNADAGRVVATQNTGYEAYQTTRGDLGAQAIMQASGIASTTIISGNGTPVVYRGITVDGASLTAIKGWSCPGLMYKCGAINCTNTGFDDNSTTGTTWKQCYATGCTTAGAAFLMANAIGVNCIDCIAYDNTIVGFSMDIGATAIRCISYGNSGASSDGFYMTGSGAHCCECVAYDNGRDGFRIDGGANLIQNCLSEGHAAGWGFIITGASARNNQLANCGSYDNNSGDFSIANTASNRNYSSVTGSSSFFVNAAGADFALNNTAGGGLDAQGVGYPGALPVGGTGYIDLGALQHQDGGGGSPGGGGGSEVAYGFIG